MNFLTWCWGRRRNRLYLQSLKYLQLSPPPNLAWEQRSGILFCKRSHPWNTLGNFFISLPIYCCLFFYFWSPPLPIYIPKVNKTGKLVTKVHKIWTVSGKREGKGDLEITISISNRVNGACCRARGGEVDVMAGERLREKTRSRSWESGRSRGWYRHNSVSSPASLSPQDRPHHWGAWGHSSAMQTGAVRAP